MVRIRSLDFPSPPMRPAAIGPFRIERELGRGGMGEVYLATDTRLDRQVAIKALPAQLAADPDRLARFQREAKVLASLNHPGIGAIYGLEEANGHQYLILEFVAGQTLAERLAAGPLPLDEALAVARQIAEALEFAHEKGIVHRDVKPGNVMVTAAGVVKVLDFGLARTADVPPSAPGTSTPPGSPTVASPARMAPAPTIPGAILGTVGYLSPEQARGKPIDKRSDVFAFGCVLYELLTGVPPFAGETIVDAINATMHQEPDLARLPAATPASVRQLLVQCLTKDRAGRLRDIGDAWLVLTRVHQDPGDAAMGPGGVAPPRRSLRPLPLMVLAAVALLGGTFPLWSQRLGLASAPAPAPRQVVRFQIEPPPGFTLPLFVGSGTAIAISPAGDRIVFVAEADRTSCLCVRDVASGVSRVLPDTTHGTSPFFSPDGKWLAFIAKGRLLRVPAAGGPALTICELTQFASFAWLDDGTIVWGAGNAGLWRVRADGGKPEQLAKVGRDTKAPEGGGPVLGFDVPVHVPGADYFLCCSYDGSTMESFNVLAVSRADASARTVLRAATEPRLIAPDRLLFTRGTTVMTVGFDPIRGVVVGEPRVALEGVRTDQWQDSAFLAASVGGAFAFVPGGRFGSGKRLIRVDETGTATPVVAAPDNYYSMPAVTADGGRAAIATLRSKMELWVLDLERRSMTLVSAAGEHYGPIWSIDGTSILDQYVAPDGNASIARWPATGGGGPKLLPGTTLTQDFMLPLQELPDGSGLLLQTQSGDVSSKPDLARYDYAKASLTPVRNRPAAETDACLSPDGKLLAYASDELERSEVYLGPFDGSGPDVQVSANGGAWPRFAADGKRLFFLDPDEKLMAATLEVPGTAPVVSSPTVLFDAKRLHVQPASRGGFSVLPDGGFLMIQKAAWEEVAPRIHVILNWIDELDAGRSRG